MTGPGSGVSHTQPAASLGRPLIGESLKNVMEVFGTVMPTGVEVEVVAPGMKYVRASILSTILEAQDYSVDPSQLELWMGGLVAGLYNEELLTTEAFQSVQVPIREVKVCRPYAEQGKTPPPEFHIQLDDPEDERYQSGFMLNGEKLSINHSLGVRYRNRGNKPRIRATRVNLGPISQPELVTDPMLQEFKYHLRGGVVLDRIGLVL